MVKRTVKSIPNIPDKAVTDKFVNVEKELKKEKPKKKITFNELFKGKKECKCKCKKKCDGSK